MRKYGLFWGIILCGCATVTDYDSQARYRVNTERTPAYYLSTDPKLVQDTCPQHDILHSFTCTKAQADGLRCFDVYLAQGSPINEQRYTLLQQTIEEKNVSAQPPCPPGMQADCASFLKALNYNLEFSWYLADFPSSSFEECAETYDCKRIDCYFPSSTDTVSTLVSCVYKRNQVFFVGSEITCRQEFY